MIRPRRVLAAVDFSDSSRVALGLAARLAVQCRASLCVLYAEDPLLCAAARTAGVELGREARDELASFVHTTPPAEHCAFDRLVVSGPAAEVVCTIGEREQADVIVVGAHGMSGPSTLLFGSTTERVLRQARTSVLVVPSDWQPAAEPELTGFGAVIVGVDFHPPSIAAAVAAARLAGHLNTTLDLVHVVPEYPVIGRWTRHAQAATMSAVHDAERELAALAARLSPCVPSRVQILTGQVADVLTQLTQAKRGRPPLLVIGRRQGDKAGGALGTVAHRVLGSLRTPLLVVEDAAA